MSPRLRRWPCLLWLLLVGCASVEPWQKERLGSPSMQFRQANPAEFFLEHSVITLEQAEGGRGTAGGGCGCR